MGCILHVIGVKQFCIVGHICYFFVYCIYNKFVLLLFIVWHSYLDLRTLLTNGFDRKAPYGNHCLGQLSEGKLIEQIG